MKNTLVASIVIFIVLIAISQNTEANRQQYYTHKVSNSPPRHSHQPPQIIRVHNQPVLGGNSGKHTADHVAGKVEISKSVHYQKTDFKASAFAKANANGRPITAGGTLAADRKRVGAAISKEHTIGVSDKLTKTAHARLFDGDTHKLDGKIFDERTRQYHGKDSHKQGGSLQLTNNRGDSFSVAKERVPGVSKTLTETAKVNIYNNGGNKVEANLINSKTNFNNGLTSQKQGANLDWTHGNDYGAKVDFTKDDKGKKLTVDGHTNLYESQDKTSRLDLSGGVTRQFGGQNDVHANLVYKKTFP